jgi:glycosyltransferase involved in cell wall biosynthesis
VNRPPQIPVAVFLTRFEPGGTERQMTELIRRLDPRRFAVHVACFDTRGAWYSRVAQVAASVAAFPIDGFARPRTFAQLLRFAGWCRTHRIAVLQTCDLYANVFGLAGAALAGVPVRVGSRRELNPDKTPGQIRLQRFAYRFATRVVANSPSAAAVLESEGVPPGKISLIPNGVDVDAHAPPAQRPQIRELITVANLRVEKSHETLIAAAAALAPRHPHLRCSIVGAGSRLRELQALARARGVERVVQFCGHREDVPALLAAADLFVLPSRSEACPNGAIEAMAAGLPVVASAVGGLRDLVDHGRTGLLVPPCNPEALASAVEALIADPVRAHRLGAAARAEVEARYSFDRMVRAFEDLYEHELRARTSLPRTAEVRA